MRRSLHATLRARLLGLALSTPILAIAGTPPVGAPDPNLVPNAGLHGDAGANGGATGTIPTLWRAFAIGGGALSVTPVPLAAGALFAGSPPANANRICVTAFGTDQGFDHAQVLFPVLAGRRYVASFHVRSGNSGGAPQGLDMTFPLFDAAGAFNGRSPGSLTTNAGASWTPVTGPAFDAIAGDAFGHLAFRLANDGGENCVEIAWPIVGGPAQVNETPNPRFAGTGGAATPVQVTGTVPNLWRAFAVGAGTLNVSIVPVGAGELFPGSPPTQAVRLAVTGGNGSLEGFDHELARSVLAVGHRYHGQVWLKSGNAGGAAQGVTVSLPIFDPGGTFTGNQPGSFATTAGANWSLHAGPQFEAPAGHTTNLAFRLAADGGQDVILIAAPRLVGPAGPLTFRDEFEAP